MSSFGLYQRLALSESPDANEFPTGLLLNSSAVVREQQPAGTIGGILRALDPDVEDAHTFLLPVKSRYAIISLFYERLFPDK